VAAPWTISDGPESVSVSIDGRGWAWHLTSHDDESVHRVELLVTNQAKEMRHATAAFESKGRTAVEDVLDWRVPPGRITYMVSGVDYAHGQRD
jgi:hypothetical protein